LAFLCRRFASALLILLAPVVAVSQAKPPTTSSASPESGLGPGDFIVIKIWREPDLSDTVTVDNGGVAVFPKLGQVQVTGIGPDSLERLLVSQYARYLQNPSIRVTVLRRITIWGAVVKPGTYPVDLTMTITDALALAGGAASNGKTNEVELRRGSHRTVLDLSRNIQQVRDISLHSGDQLFVPERSWASRNAGLIVAAIGTAATIGWLVRNQ